jgi:hypothetical protein
MQTLSVSFPSHAHIVNHVNHANHPLSSITANMLSYNTSVGQRPSSSGAMPPSRQNIPPSPKTTISNGVMANGTTSADGSPAKQQHIWLVTGPAGCGKSTVAKHIANALQFPFIEGDEVRYLMLHGGVPTRYSNAILTISL